MRPPRPSQNGFTLIELLVAVVILGLAYVTILQSFSLSGRNIVRLEKKRLDLHHSALSLLQESRLDDGDIYLQGSTFQLVTVASADGELQTLRLERRSQ